MSRVVVDGIFKDWGDRIDYQPISVRHVRNVKGGVINKKTVVGTGGSSNSRPSSASTSGGSVRAKLTRTVNKSPEVMVKISGGGKNMGAIKAHMDYISRDGEVEIEDENGNIHLGKDEVGDARDSWEKGGVGIPAAGDKRKEAFNIVLSMPPGTEREAVKNAARNFAAEQFKDHQYVFAAHNDENHPHIHLSVKAASMKGVRLNPRKADLQEWRESFAEKLRDEGIEANATPRHARGVTKKAEKQSVRHMDNRFKRGEAEAPSRASIGQISAAVNEVKGGGKHINPAEDKIKSIRNDTHKSYGTVAKALLAGNDEDRALATKIVSFVKKMPGIETKHDSRVVKIEERGDEVTRGETSMQTIENALKADLSR